MEISVNIGGLLSESIKVKNGVKQSNLVVPTLIFIFFSVVVLCVVKDSDQSMYIQYCTSKLVPFLMFLY